MTCCGTCCRVGIISTSWLCQRSNTSECIFTSDSFNHVTQCVKIYVWKHTYIYNTLRSFSPVVPCQEKKTPVPRFTHTHTCKHTHRHTHVRTPSGHEWRHGGWKPSPRHHAAQTGWRRLTCSSCRPDIARHRRNCFAGPSQRHPQELQRNNVAVQGQSDIIRICLLKYLDIFCGIEY